MNITEENNLIATCAWYALYSIDRPFVKVRSQLIFISLLVFAPSLVSAQKIEKDNFEAIVKFIPSSLLTPETPTLRLGVELLFPKFIKHGMSVEFDYGFRCNVGILYPDVTWGYGAYVLDPRNIDEKHYSKYHLEVRKYFKPIRRSTLYLAAEGFYIPYTFLLEGGLTSNGYSFSSAQGSKDIRGGAVKFGIVIRLKSIPKLSIDYFVGLGLRKVNLTYSDLVNKIRYYHSQSYEDYHIHEGTETYFRPHIAMGVRIGYRIL